MKQVLLVNAPHQDDINRDEENDEASLIQQQKLKQQQQNLQLEQEVMLEREQRVRQIEADVLDINEIMKELSSLAHQQGSAVGKSLKRACLSFSLLYMYLNLLPNFIKRSLFEGC